MSKLFKVIYYIVNTIGILLTIGGFFLIFYVGVTGAFIMMLGIAIIISNIILFWLVSSLIRKNRK